MFTKKFIKTKIQLKKDFYGKKITFYKNFTKKKKLSLEKKKFHQKTFIKKINLKQIRQNICIFKQFHDSTYL